MTRFVENAKVLPENIVLQTIHVFHVLSTNHLTFKIQSGFHKSNVYHLLICRDVFCLHYVGTLFYNYNQPLIKSKNCQNARPDAANRIAGLFNKSLSQSSLTVLYNLKTILAS